MDEVGINDRLVNILGPWDGAEIPGGCGGCDAYQTVRAQSERVWIITIHHDDDCPVWQRIKAKR